MHSTSNPYLHALSISWNRLRWDLDWRSWISRNRLNKIKNQSHGGKAIVVCNGPSLLKTDWRLLPDCYTFGLNKINLLFDRTDWRPDCIVAINQFVLEQNASFFSTTDIPLYLNETGARFIPFRKNVTFLHLSVQNKLARDASISIHAGATVTVAALQLAYHCGFRDIGLVGCDHNFAQKGPSNKTVISGEKDQSHFDSRYFSGGVKWQLPDLVASEYYYDLAGQMFAEDGGRIVNCTEGGLLEVFPRASLAEWLSNRLER